MTHFSFDIVGFDLDGTLLDTSADLAEAVNHALALIGRAPLTLAEVRPMVGRGAKHMLEQGLAATGGCDPAALQRLYPELLTFYEAHLARHSAPYPGLLDTLDGLAERDATLAIVTNKLERLAVKLIDELGLSPRFATIIGGDTMGPGRSKPSPFPIREMIARCGGGRAAFVGDSIFDIQAAKNAGIPSIAVSFGFPAHPTDLLGADARIDSYADLIPTLERLA
jgi:phosphoglycolate phosphatase